MMKTGGLTPIVLMLLVSVDVIMAQNEGSAIAKNPVTQSYEFKELTENLYCNYHQSPVLFKILCSVNSSLCIVEKTSVD